MRNPCVVSGPPLLSLLIDDFGNVIQKTLQKRPTPASTTNVGHAEHHSVICRAEEMSLIVRVCEKFPFALA